ncbi:MAG: hypothetical protein WEC14_04675 [Chloroflexota bacterium]
METREAKLIEDLGAIVESDDDFNASERTLKSMIAEHYGGLNADAAVDAYLGYALMAISEAMLSSRLRA